MVNVPSHHSTNSTEQKNMMRKLGTIESLEATRENSESGSRNDNT